MNKAILATAIALGLNALVAVEASASQLPADRRLSFAIHEDPYDPASPVTFTVYLSLLAKSATADQVGWEIDSVTIRQHGDYGDTRWTEELPYVNSPDGLWWVTHDDVLAPALDEFADVPFLSGTALADDPSNDDDLDYDFEGTTYQVPLDGKPYQHTAGISYWFQRATEPEPEEEDDEVPLDVGDEDE